MSFLKKTSFASGEIDPSLHDNTDLKSYYSGLNTARGVTIGKNGRVLNTAGTWYYADTYANDATTKIYVPDNQDYFFEFGVGYVRCNPLSLLANQIYLRPTTAYPQIATSYVLADLSLLKFATIKESDGVFWTYVACKGKILEAFTFDGAGILRRSQDGYFGVYVDLPYIENYSIPTTLAEIQYNITQATMNGRVGHPVQYGITAVMQDGTETELFPIQTYRSSDNLTSSYIFIPTGNESTGFNVVNITVNVAKYANNIRNLNIYRRPIYQGSTNDGFSWGLIGQSQAGVSLSAGANYTFGFNDFGQEADYTNPPPDRSSDFPKILVQQGAPSPTGVAPRRVFYKVSNIASYQNRLVLILDNLIFASKTSFPNYFLRDFPASATTSFNFPVGVAGEIYDMIESNGLIAFSSEGVFYGGYDSPISSLNPLLPKRGKLIIDSSVRPINTPYGIFFIDRATNSIKTLDYDDNAKSMMAEDVSLYSDHLFYLRKVKNWVFKEGSDPHLETVMDDGTVLHLSYNKAEKIMAWTRHDTLGYYKDITTYFDKTTGETHCIYVVARGSLRHLEISSRRIKKDTGTIRAFSHASIKNQISLYPLPEVLIDLVLTTTSWSDPLKFGPTVGAYFVANVGKTFIAYTPDGSQRVYLTLQSATLGVEAIFLPDRELPASLRGVNFEIIECHTTVSGLTHLNGKKVSVVCDGDVVSSPNNNHPATAPAQVLTVSGGSITLPKPSGFTVVGLPYISDTVTLDVDDKNGASLTNAKISNKVAVKYSRSRGGYVSGKLSDGNGVETMEDADSWNRDDNINLPLAEKTIRRSYSIYSDYQVNGKIAIRQVDPLPLEIVSIILDIVGG